MTRSFYIYTLGCDKNTVDSEKMAFALECAGFAQVEDAQSAELIILNTCGFIDRAKEESVAAIFEAVGIKQQAGGKTLIVAGCLSERYKSELAKEIPDVDFFCGTDAVGEILSYLGAGASGEAALEGRILSTPSHYAYLKISEGCNKTCSFCAIPSIRGKLRSEAMEPLLAEAQRLAKEGVKELILVAQDTGSYGMDIYGEKKLPQLLSALSEIQGIHWIRLLYMYPESITPQLIALMRANKKILHYIDIPFQHASDDILAAMGRPSNREKNLEVIALLREAMPDIAIRSTFICGFPGETRKDVAELAEFLTLCRLDRVGVFEYSKEEHTPAAKMPKQVAKAEKRRRYEELMSCQEALSEQKLLSRIGSAMEILIDEEEAPGVYAGRSYLDAPDVDGCVSVYSDAPLSPGTFVIAEITGATAHDLIAESPKECTIESSE